PGSAAPSAPVTAPCDGFWGTLPAEYWGLSAAGVGVWVSFAFPPPPIEDLIASPSGPLDAGWLGGRSFAASFGSGAGGAFAGLSLFASAPLPPTLAPPPTAPDLAIGFVGVSSCVTVSPSSGAVVVGAGFAAGSATATCSVAAAEVSATGAGA